ncbi:vasa-related protein CnVAS2 [Aphelenchoides avenae]|nr:vasa-related protein CnVAS2 [Aphelenchus avenae]
MTTTIRFEDLPEGTDEDDLIELCSRMGQVENAHMTYGEDGGDECYGYVEFTEEDPVENAVYELDQSEYNGKTIRVIAWYYD